MNTKYFLQLLLLTLTILSACNKDERVVAPTISNEALTTVQLHLTSTAADSASTQWEQLLDNNGNPKAIDFSKDTLRLAANTTYSSRLVMLDKTQVPVYNVTDEIEARANYHLFFYQPLATSSALVIPNNYPTDPGDLYPAPIPTPVPVQASLNLSVTINDTDTNNPVLPLGIKTTFVTGAVSTGWLRLVLRHQPNQKNGTYAPGSTDLDVAFVVIIK